MSLWTFALMWLLWSSAVLVFVAWADDALARRRAQRPRAPREPADWADDKNGTDR